MDLEAIKVTRFIGTEPFHATGASLGCDLLSFWQWASSDICGNALRGLVAEYLVARALGTDGGVRTEWNDHDAVTSAGSKIEVKSSAYLQSWRQTKLSTITFDIAPKRGWDASTNTTAKEPSRPADTYVFALHAHKDKATLDPLNVAQWDFYVLRTGVLNERCPRQKTINLPSLLRLGPIKTGFEKLGEVIL
jgi:hypothetical protein